MFGGTIVLSSSDEAAQAVDLEYWLQRRPDPPHDVAVTQRVPDSATAIEPIYDVAVTQRVPNSAATTQPINEPRPEMKIDMVTLRTLIGSPAEYGRALGSMF